MRGCAGELSFGSVVDGGSEMDIGMPWSRLDAELDKAQGLGVSFTGKPVNARPPSRGGATGVSVLA